MRVLIIVLCALTSYSYGQVSKKEILGKWFLINFDVDSIPVVDKKNPMNVVSKNMYQLKKLNTNYTSADSIEYANQIMIRMRSLDNYSIEFLNNGTYRNTKIVRGRVIEGTEEGLFEIDETRQTLIQTDSKQRTSESRIELNDKILRLFIKIGDKETLMTFEKSNENAR